MRIRDTTFLLSLNIRCLDGTCIDFFDTDFHTLSVHRRATGTTEQFDVEISLPSKIILRIATKEKTEATSPLAELSKMKFAGLAVAKEKILPHLVFHPGDRDGPLVLNRIQNLPAQNTLSWTAGYVILNFFHPDPFAWHLLIGNKIQFHI